MDFVWSPWRYHYIASAGKTPSSCVFCIGEDPSRDADRLVVFRGVHNFVILNLFPYTSGHFMVARALLRPGRSYDEAVDAFAPYDRIQDPNPELRRDLARLVETAVRTRIPAYLLVNNRAEGSAPLTIAEVARLLPEPDR